MEPYHQIFPAAHDPIMTLILKRKTGRIPKGTYGFIECYCNEPQCDCRRVTLIVLNEKLKQKAVISFGFDQEGPMAGPYLDTSNDQSPYAPELLSFFVESLNSNPAWLDRMYRQYRAVRAVVDRKPYTSKQFPKPGKLVYQVMPPPDLEAEIEQTLKELRASSPRSPSAHRMRKGNPQTPPGFPDQSHPAGRASSRTAESGMASLVERYVKASTGGPIADLLALQDELRRYLFANENAGDELASLLPVLCQQSPEDDEHIEAALRLLFDALNLLRVALEEHRPGAKQQMERLQNALAQRVFIENEDLDLCMAVTNIVLQSRVEVLPVLREANTKMMASDAARLDLHDLPGEDILAGISRSLESMGVTSPFEGVEAMLELFTLNEPEMQTALIGEMLSAQNPTLREMSVLMLFHPDPEVRLGVSQVLRGLDGRNITPQSLRRLIVSRNWFAEEIRKNIDQAITNARKARVECAPLAKPPSMAVHASFIDGVGTQSFQVITPDGKGYISCSILLKPRVGVADAFVVPIKSKRELNDFLTVLKTEASFIESSPDHLDLRICQALADGVSHGCAPTHWLVRIAELLGRDRWNPAPFDARRELVQLREELAAHHPKLLDEREYLAALDKSGDWHLGEPIFSSWFEKDETVVREIEASRGKKNSLAAAIKYILEVVLENRRAVWLERLVLATLWLKSSRKAPLPWHGLFHVAQAMADDSLPLKKIPLMVGVAQCTLEAHEARREEGRLRPGETE